MTGFVHIEVTEEGLSVNTELRNVGVMDRAQMFHAFCTSLHIKNSEALLFTSMMEKLDACATFVDNSDSKKDKKEN